MSSPPANRIARPLYSLDGIVIGTLLGSLVAGIYMVAHNYLALGSVRLAKQTLVVGMVLYAIVIAGSSIAPASLWTALIFALGQTGLAYLLASRLQGASISYYAQRDGQIHGLFRSALVGLLAGVLSFAVTLGLFALIAI